MNLPVSGKSLKMGTQVYKVLCGSKGNCKHLGKNVVTQVILTWTWKQHILYEKIRLIKLLVWNLADVTVFRPAAVAGTTTSKGYKQLA